MSEVQPFHAEAQQDALNECQKSPYIDLLPIELLEWVIFLGIRAPDNECQDIKWTFVWRGVSRKWKNVIDNCPSLWSTISVGFTDLLQQVETQLEKSKGVLLDLQVSEFEGDPMDSSSVQLLLDNTHRWRSLMLDGDLETFVALLKSLSPSLTDVEILNATIPRDYRLFSLVRPNLRKLSLCSVTVAHDFDPPLGLEDLEITDCEELLEDGSTDDLSMNKFHQFLNANPNLRILELKGSSDTSLDDGLQPVNLSKLEKVTLDGCQVVMDLFRAEHCVELSLTLDLVQEKPPLSAWTTFVRGFRRVERVRIVVSEHYLWITTEGGPNKVEISADRTDARYEDLRISILEDILDEAEKDTHISARVELALLDRSDSGFNINLEVLKLLQTPVSDSFSGKTLWRLPNLDTIVMYPGGLPYHHLRAFVQARSNGCCIQPASPVTSISIRPNLRAEGSDCEEVLDKVMACIGGGKDQFVSVTGSKEFVL